MLQPQRSSRGMDRPLVPFLSRRLLMTGVLAVVTILPANQVARGQNDPLTPALNAIPANVQAVLLIPDLSKLNQEVSMLSGALDLAMLSDAVGQFKSITGMRNGFRDDGPMLVFTEDLKGALSTAGQLMMLIPVADYEILAESLGVPKDTDGPSPVTLATGHTGFIKKAEGFVVFGSSEQKVGAYKPANAAGKRLAGFGDLGKRSLQGNPIFLLIDPAGKGPFLEMLSNLLSNVADLFPLLHLADSHIERAHENLDALIKEADSVLVGMDLGVDGVSLTMTAHYKAGSKSAQQTKAGGGAALQLALLPDRPLVAAFSANTAAMPPLLSGLMGLGSNHSEVLPLIQKSQRNSAALYVPPPNSQPIHGVMVGEVVDPKAVVGAFKTYIATRNTDPQPGEPAGWETTYLANAVTLEGLSLDQYQVRAPFDAQMAMGGMAMFLSDFGGYVVGRDKMVLATFGPDIELTRAALGFSKRGGGLGSSGHIFEQRRRALGGDPVMESYLDLSGLYKVPVVQMFPHPVQPPDNLPPMAHYADVVDGEVGMQLFLPAPVIGFLKDLVLDSLQSDEAPQERVGIAE